MSLVLLEEWEKELNKYAKHVSSILPLLIHYRHTQPSSLRVTRYHGHDRAKHFSELLSFDVVLTTYGTVTKDFNKIYRGGREALFYVRWFRLVLDEGLLFLLFY